MVKNTTARDIGICMIHETLFGSGVFGLGQIHFSFGILGGNLGEQGNGRFVAYWIGNTEMIPFCNV